MGRPADPDLPPAGDAAGRRTPVLTLRYEAASGLLRDRLNDVPRGIMARTLEPIRVGDVVDLWIHVVRDGVGIAARGTALWTMPLTRGTLVGFGLDAASPREVAQLDALLDRGSGARASDPKNPPDARSLSVLMLQPDPALRQLLSSALARLAGKGEAAWNLEIDVVTSAQAFLTASDLRLRGLAVIDCDGLDTAPDALLSALRSRRAERLPVIVLSETRAARFEDGRTVTMRKPVTVKSFVQTADLLLRS